MFTLERVKLIREQGFAHCGRGFSSQLAIESGMSRQTVSSFLNGKHVSQKTAESIYDAALALIEKAKRDKKKRERKENLLFRLDQPDNGAGEETSVSLT